MIRKALHNLIKHTQKFDKDIEDSIKNVVKFQERIKTEAHRLKNRKG